VADALAYVWILEGLFAVVWSPWFWEQAEAIRSGEFVAELLRPGDPYLRLLAFDLGRTLSVLVTRTVPTLTVAALVLPLRLPGTLGGLALLGASLVLAAVVSFQLRFLFGSAAFWTPDYRSLFMLVFPVLWLASGFVVPVDFFPGPLRALVDWSPLIPLLMAPVRVATGRAAGLAVAGQVAWVALLWLAGRLALAAAGRRLVVHGG
jgi:ABC-2 type transport system permease protein